EAEQHRDAGGGPGHGEQEERDGGQGVPLLLAPAEEERARGETEQESAELAPRGELRDRRGSRRMERQQQRRDQRGRTRPLRSDPGLEQPDQEGAQGERDADQEEQCLEAPGERPATRVWDARREKRDERPAARGPTVEQSGAIPAEEPRAQERRMREREQRGEG